MGLIREPLDVDFYVDPTPPTAKDFEKISEYIRKHKEEYAQKQKANASKKNKAKPKVKMV